MVMKKIFFKIILCVSLLFICWGCEEQKQNPGSSPIVSKKVSEQPEFFKEAAMPIETAEVTEEKKTEMIVLAEKTDFYDDSGKPDPFKPVFGYEDKKESPVPQGHVVKRCPETEPLAQYDISQLKLVGIIHTPNGDMALIQEASSRGHIVRNGTCIGINSGKVSRIMQDKIVIEEKYVDYVKGKEGNWAEEMVTRELEMKINKSSEA